MLNSTITITSYFSPIFPADLAGIFIAQNHALPSFESLIRA